MPPPDRAVRLRLRRLAPEPLKRLLRLLRVAVVQAPPAAPELPQELLASCEFLASRYLMLDRIPKGSVIAELGVLYGHFTREIIARSSPAALHLIDVDFAPLAAEIRDDPRVTLHAGLTYDVVPRLANETFDFIYIDADHSYPAVRLDIANAVPKLKPGGLIAFNDFARISRPGLGIFGVHQAVSEFIVTSRWDVAYFCFSGEALYDIALRKP
jgi:SAM-dependent methyltransferase